MHVGLLAVPSTNPRFTQQMSEALDTNKLDGDLQAQDVILRSQKPRIGRTVLSRGAGCLILNAESDHAPTVTFNLGQACKLYTLSVCMVPGDGIGAGMATKSVASPRRGFQELPRH